jgi:hypothetical protein
MHASQCLRFASNRFMRKRRLSDLKVYIIPGQNDDNSPQPRNYSKSSERELYESYCLLVITISFVLYFFFNKLCKKTKQKTYTPLHFFCCSGSSTCLPGGNLVDGLPSVLNNSYCKCQCIIAKNTFQIRKS